MEKMEKQAHEIFGATIRIDSDDFNTAHERARIFIEDLKEIEAITKRISALPWLPDTVNIINPGTIKERSELEEMISVAKQRMKEECHPQEKCQVDVPPGEEGEIEGNTLERLLALGKQNEAILYRMAADELEGKRICPEAVTAVYIYEANQLPRVVHTAREKIRVRFKACLKLSMMLLEDGYERIAADNIGEFIQAIRLVPGM